MPQTVTLFGPDRRPVATAQATDEGAYFGGTVDLRRCPSHLHALFAEFEELVNTQVFTRADEAQEKIQALALRAVFADGTEAVVNDRQVFPSTGELSFRLTEGVCPASARSGV